MSDIFISYASEDRPRAQLLAKALENEGWLTFWDRTIPIGKTWREVIGEELLAARCVIVLWSKNSIESKWVQEEADDGGRRGVLIPVLIDGVLPPIGFRSIQAADLSDWDGAKPTTAYNRLIDDIAALIGPPGKEGDTKRKSVVPSSMARPEEAAQLRTTGNKGKAEGNYAPVLGKRRRKVRLAGLFVVLVLLVMATTWYVQEQRLEAERRLQQAKVEQERSKILAEVREERRRAAAEAERKSEAARMAAAAKADRVAEEEHRRDTAAADRKAADDARRAEEEAREAETQLRLTRAERRDVQRILRLQGYEVGSFDGIFGTKTRSAIRMWQRAAGEAPTGYFANKDQYTRFWLAASEKVRELPAPHVIPIRVFRIPHADITIDGQKDDWWGVEPVFVDLSGEQKAYLPGTDLGAFYMAINEPYLCLAMTLNNGPPDPSRDTMYFFVAQQEPFATDLPGDRDAATSFSSGKWHVWTDTRGHGGAPSGEASDYPPHFAAYGSNFVEWKVLLSDMQPLSGRFVRTYIHVEGERVSDVGLRGIELIVD